MLADRSESDEALDLGVDAAPPLLERGAVATADVDIQVHAILEALRLRDLLKEDAKKKILPLKKQESIEYNVFELMDRDRESMAKNILRGFTFWVLLHWPMAISQNFTNNTFSKPNCTNHE